MNDFAKKREDTAVPGEFAKNRLPSLERTTIIRQGIRDKINRPGFLLICSFMLPVDNQSLLTYRLRYQSMILLRINALCDSCKTKYEQYKTKHHQRRRKADIKSNKEMRMAKIVSRLTSLSPDINRLPIGKYSSFLYAPALRRD